MKRALWVTAGLALLFRGIWVWQWVHSPLLFNPTPDGQIYHRWAAAIAGGNWLGSGMTSFHPGYLYGLGGLYTLGGSSVFLAVVVQSLMGVAAAVGIAWAAGAALGVPAAWAAGGLAAGYRPAIFFEGLIATASWIHLFTVAAMAVFLAAAHRPARAVVVAGVAGVALGWSTAMRASGILGLLVVLAWGLRVFPRPVRAGALGACLLGWMAILLPFVIRFQVLEHRWWVEGAAGLLFQQLNAPGGRGVGYGVLSGEPLDPLSQAGWAAARGPAGRGQTGIRVVTTQPGNWLNLVRQRFVRVWHRREHGLLADPDFYAAWIPLLRWPLPGFGLVGPLALAGLALALWSRAPGGLLPAGFFLTSLSIPLVFSVTADYRFPMAAPGLVLAGGAVAWLAAQVRVRRWIPLCVALLLMVGWGAFCNRRDIGAYPEGSHLNLGYAYQAAGRFAEARGEFEKALAAAPHWEPAVKALRGLPRPSPSFPRRVGAVSWPPTSHVGGNNRNRPHY